jgi:hypothetical protein
MAGFARHLLRGIRTPLISEENMKETLTKKQLAEMKEFKVKRVFHGPFHALNHDELKKHFVAKLKELYGAKFVESEVQDSPNGFGYKDRFVMKSKIMPESFGKVKMRSKDYVYVYQNEKGENVESYGPELVEIELTEKGWITECIGGKIEYIILDL